MPIPIGAATPRRASDPTVPADRVAGGTVATASSATCLGAAGGAVAAIPGRPARWRRTAPLVPGLTAAIVLAIVATFAGRLEPVIGGPVFGIVLGMLVATFRCGTGLLKPGAAFAGRCCRLRSSCSVPGCRWRRRRTPACPRCRSCSARSRSAC